MADPKFHLCDAATGAVVSPLVSVLGARRRVATALGLEVVDVTVGDRDPHGELPMIAAGKATAYTLAAKADVEAR